MRTIIGSCLGVKTSKVGKPGNQFDITELGIGEKTNDGFGTEETVKLRLSKEQIDNGWPKKLDDLKGQDIQVSYFTTKRESNGRTYESMYLVGIIDPSKPASRQAA